MSVRARRFWILRGMLITLALAYLLTFSLPDPSSEEDEADRPLDHAVGSCDLDGAVVTTTIAIDGSTPDGIVLTITDELSGRKTVRDLAQVAATRARSACLPWYWQDAQFRSIDGELTLRRESFERRLEGPVRLLGWTVDIDGRIVTLEHVGVSTDIGSDPLSEYRGLPWTVEVELAGVGWDELPTGTATPDSFDDESGSWSLDEVNTDFALRLTAPRLVAAQFTIDDYLTDKAELTRAIMLGAGAPLAFAYMLRARRRHRDVMSAALLLVAMYVIVVLVQWSAIDGVMVQPAETLWLVIPSVILPLLALLSVAALDMRTRAVVGWYTLVAAICLALYIVEVDDSERWSRVTLAAMFVLVLSSLLLTGYAIVRALLAVNHWTGGGPGRDWVHVLVLLSVGALVLAMTVAAVSEWIDTYDFVTEEPTLEPLTDATTKLLAFHPVLTFAWPQILTLLSVLVVARASTMTETNAQRAIPIRSTWYWGVVLVFGLAVVGPSGRYVGLEVPVGLIAFVAIAVAAQRLTPPIEQLLRENDLRLNDVTQGRNELLLRGLELERLSVRRESILRRSSDEGMTTADLHADIKDIDTRMDLIGREGIGVPRQGLALQSRDEYDRLLFNGGVTSSWVENAKLAVRRGALLALFPVGYFVTILIEDVPDSTGGIDSVTDLVLVLAEIAYWLGAAFALGALSAWLPGSRHLTKGLGLAAVYAFVTGLSAVLSSALGVDTWAGWRFSVSQTFLFLALLGVLLDHAIVANNGLTWRQLVDLYRVGRVQSLLSYAAPIALALLSVSAQIISGDASAVIESVTENARSIIP